MHTHLTDDQLAELIVEESDSPAAAHVEQCLQCQSEEKSLRATLLQWAAQTRAAAERPAGFWYSQKLAILHRLAGRLAARALSWAVAMVAVALTLSLSFEPSRPAPAVAEIDPDQMLLLEVQNSVRRPVPRALEPATLLAEDLSKASKSGTRR